MIFILNSINLIKKVSIFEKMSDEEIKKMLKCLSATTKNYKKDETLIYCGDEINSIGILLFGTLRIQYEDFWGNTNIVTDITPGQMFAEAYACVDGAKSNVNVVASGDCGVMYINVKNIMTTCRMDCEFHLGLIHSLLAQMAQKTLKINGKLRHVTQRSTREKLLSYLSYEAERAGCETFVIPFNRQQLADYLAVERSALSRELCRMRDEGLISFKKSSFTLL